jgi:hypothetical protein
VTGDRRRTARPGRIAALLAVAFLALGCAANRGALQAAGKPGHRARQPASSAPSDTPATAPPPSRVRAPAAPFASIRRYLAARSGQVTAALFDERTGQTWVLHRRMIQDTASIVKVEIMGTALREAQARGGGLPAAERALMPSMIEASDNQSASALWADVGGPRAIGRFDRSAGMSHTTPSTLALIPWTDLPGWGLTTTSALDEVALVRTFAYPNSLLTDGSRKYGLSLMKQVEYGQNWGITGGVPAGVTVALKNGWLPLPPTNSWQINSIGWVHGHGRNYVLAVLTDSNPDEAYGIDTINHISGLIFAELKPRE